MSLLISLSVVPKESSPIALIDYSEEFSEPTHLANLIGSEQFAFIEIEGGLKSVIFRDTLDDLVLGLCKSGLKALKTKQTFTYVSFEQRDSYVISVDNDLARFTSVDSEVSFPIAESIEAIEEFKEKYRDLLLKADSSNTKRLERFS